MRYAVLDWDNTIRNGYTLFSWIDFLVDRKILSYSLKEKERLLGEKYDQGVITHDQYADIACEYYAQELINRKISDIVNEVEGYMEIDRKSIFPFAEEIFSFLCEHNIKPIIISGAPRIILEQYRERFSIYEIMAVEPQSNGSGYTGKLEFNYGHEKARTIKKLKEKYKEKPVIGFGDSLSDIPLLKESDYGCCVYDDTPKIELNNIFYIQKNENSDKVRKKMRSLLK